MKEGDSRLQANVLKALKHARMTDVAIIQGEEIDGYYNEEFREAGFGESAVAGFYRWFDCRLEDLPTSLAEDEEVEVVGHGTFKLQRAETDSSGRALLVLGTVL